MTEDQIVDHNEAAAKWRIDIESVARILRMGAASADIGDPDEDARYARVALTLARKCQRGLRGGKVTP